jgi:short subunit fatty acids transporter
MDTALLAPNRRAAYVALTVILVLVLAAAVVAWGTGYWQLVAFGVGPDIALLLGAGRGLAKGQVHPRAVPLYNALHRFWGPAAFGALAALALPRGYVIGALAWALHIALDRAVGYGLRTRDGFQRT